MISAVPPAATIATVVAVTVIDGTAIGQLIVASIVVLTYLANRVRTKKIDQKVDEVHIIVNSQKEQMEGRIKALEAKLELKAGEAIPSQQTVTPPTDPDPAPA